MNLVALIRMTCNLEMETSRKRVVWKAVRRVFFFLGQFFWGEKTFSQNLTSLQEIELGGWSNMI